MPDWDNINKQEFKIAEWMGYVSRALEEYGNDIKDLEKDVKGLRDGMNKLGLKIAGIAATITIIGGIVLKYLLPILPTVNK